MRELREAWTGIINEHLFTYFKSRESATSEGVTAEAQFYWEHMEKGPHRTCLWNNLGNPGFAPVTTNLLRLRQMAIAYRTSGSELEGCQPLKDDIIEALDWILANQYNERAETGGNWWDWEIGAPMALTETVLLLFQYLPKKKIEAYMAPVDKFSPDPDTFLNSTSNYPTMTSTGANRVWICKVIALRSILLEDAAMLERVRDALCLLFEYVTGGEGGFFADGSFTQHGLPYTGAYGRGLLSHLVPLLHVLQGTPFDVEDSLKGKIYDMVYQSFEPLLFRGSMMDMVSGREVTRPHLQNHEAGHIVIGAILELSTFAPREHAVRMQSMVKYWIQEDKAKSFLLHVPSYLRTFAEQVLQDDQIIAAAPAPKFKMFANMARAVLQRPEFAFGIGMHSNRIPTYESINGENLKGWYTAHGHTTLYNGDLEHYSDGYWPTVDPYRLAGVTVTDQPRTNGFGNWYRSGESWAGGTELLGQYGSAGMMLEDYRTEAFEDPMRAKKSWFLFQDEIVAVGSDIRFDGPFRVETVVENRKLNADGTNRFVVNGKFVSDRPGWSSALAGTEWMHLKGDSPGEGIGYYFPATVTLQAKRETRIGRWSDIGTGPDTEISRNYLTVWFDHGVSPQDGHYAYVLLPGKTDAETERYAVQPQVEIVQQSSAAHAVYHSSLRMLGVNFWTDERTTVREVTCTGKASVMVHITDETMEVAVSDPTYENAGSIELELDMAVSTVREADPRIEVLQLAPWVKLRFHAKDAMGATAKVRFLRSE
ncbi:polysaccharide lyase 8 family protein [Paenibacillus sp.]|uniref:polysaccharide lyase 8 family protein n=1 Tax=Paenibacillus sp. TaxID=58172 RepID=UPI002D672E42|nr:polysaccharide lyase 8 family protein [Paenibacillus sp.]HZG87988.1 polysaccharide lyase 8 family protein [Paenibacillus sp.]